ncbi:MAG TPA: hypothetical protein VM577_16780 [Anaerovoracaceae bacterium]|nr:hypothetical protein [Anaerovoracaceae bacterium]
MEVMTDQVIFKFSRNNEPVLKVASGSSIKIHTLDCFSNQLRKPEDKMAALGLGQNQPGNRADLYKRSGAGRSSEGNDSSDRIR